MASMASDDVTHELPPAVLSDEAYHPLPPRTIAETGLSESLIESLVCKHLLAMETSSGRRLAEKLGLSFAVLQEMLPLLGVRQLVAHGGPAPLNDFYYSLTESGRARAQGFLDSCNYVGPAPVPLIDYVLSVEAQAPSAEAPNRDHLEQAFTGISVDPALFERLGPAIHSGGGLLLYGASGNGKSTLARHIALCFDQSIWIPQTLVEDGQLIVLYDTAYHEPVADEDTALIRRSDYDRRWVKVRRPRVIVGGELRGDFFEIRHDAKGNVSEAPLQLKSNCGCLLLDDLGRQRTDLAELFNRWIVPLEHHHDFLTLASGKRIQVPFEQFVLFSTHLDPNDLADEAFLRRIPYKIHVDDPDEEEFHDLCALYARAFHCEYRPEAIDYLLATYYRPVNRPLRRCHPQDLLQQIRNYCMYNGWPLEMRPEHFDHVVPSYFTSALGK